MKCYKNSTYDINFTFDRVYTTNPTVRTLRSKLEYVFEEDMPGTHSTADASSDIFGQAWGLFVDQLAGPRSRSQLPGVDLNKLWLSVDIYNDRMKQLRDKVDHFNENYTRRSDLWPSTYTIVTQSSGIIGDGEDPEMFLPKVDKREDVVHDLTIELLLVDTDDVVLGVSIWLEVYALLYNLDLSRK